LVRGWFPELADTRLRQITWPEIDKHRDYVVAMLKAGVSKQTIWQRLRDEHGLQASVASFKRYVAANLPEEGLRARVTVLREDPPPGEEAQIDYGYLGSWTDPVGGRRRRVWAFVMVLALRRLMFVRPVLTMDQRAWTECHVAAFAFFGGVPHRLVTDYVARHIIRVLSGLPKIMSTRVAECGVGLRKREEPRLGSCYYTTMVTWGPSGQVSMTVNWRYLGGSGRSRAWRMAWCPVVRAERWATWPSVVARVTRCMRSSSWRRLRQVSPVAFSMTRISSSASQHSWTWARMRSGRWWNTGRRPRAPYL
jgi:hypothetical protein